MKPHTRFVTRVIDGMSGYFATVPDQVRRYRLLVWAFFIAMTVFAFAGLDKVKFDMTIEGWFAKDDPTLVALEGFRSQFGSEDNLYVIYKPKDGDVFSARSLETVRKLREDLLERQRAVKEGEVSALRHLVKITALTNAPVLRAEDDALISRQLVAREVPTDKAGLDEIRRLAASQETFPQLYYSRDGKYGAMLIETNFGTVPVDEPAPTAAVPAPAAASTATPVTAAPAMDSLSMSFDETGADQRVTRFKSTDLSEYYDFIKAVQVSLNKPEFAAHFDYHPVGNAAATEYDMLVLEEMGTLYLAMLAIMVLVLWFLFRSLSGVLWPMLVVVLSCIWTLGFAGWLGYTVTAFLILTVVMILVIGIADTIHVLSGYIYFRNKGHDHRESLREAFHGAAMASFLTTITTVLAMLSVVITPIAPIKVFGVMTAAGIGLAFIFTIYLMPLMLDLWWPHKRDRLPAKFSPLRLLPDFSKLMQRLLVGVTPFAIRNSRAIVALSLALLAVCVYGGLQVRVDTDPIAQYPKDSPIRTSFGIADKEMIGSQTLVIYLDLGSEYAFQNPQVLRQMDALQDTLESKFSQYVIRTASLVDVTKKSYQALNEDRAEMHVIPATQDLVSQTLFMFDNSNPVERRRMVSDDYSRAHVTVYLRNAGSYEYTQVFERIKQDIDATVTAMQAEHPQSRASLTGMFSLIMKGSDYLSWTSLTSFGMAIVTISLLLLVMFGSFHAGLISIIANSVPATLSFGLMGWLGLPMDFTTVLVAPIIVGIAVDDTIHFMTHYQSEVAVDGNVERALRDTVETVGQAVTYSSLILGLGLSILGLSSSVGNANVGLFGSLAIFAGLACELLLLPALIHVFQLRFEATAAAPVAAQQPA